MPASAPEPSWRRLGDRARAGRHALRAAFQPLRQRGLLGIGQRRRRVQRRHAHRRHRRVDAAGRDRRDRHARMQLGVGVKVGERHQRHRRAALRHLGVAQRAVIADQLGDIARHAACIRRRHLAAAARSRRHATAAGSRRHPGHALDTTATRGRSSRNPGVPGVHVVRGAASSPPQPSNTAHAEIPNQYAIVRRRMTHLSVAADALVHLPVETGNRHAIDATDRRPCGDVAASCRRRRRSRSS